MKNLLLLFCICSILQVNTSPEITVVYEFGDNSVCMSADQNKKLNAKAVAGFIMYSLCNYMPEHCGRSSDIGFPPEHIKEIMDEDYCEYESGLLPNSIRELQWCLHDSSLTDMKEEGLVFEILTYRYTGNASFEDWISLVADKRKEELFIDGKDIVQFLLEPIGLQYFALGMSIDFSSGVIRFKVLPPHFRFEGRSCSLSLLVRSYKDYIDIVEKGNMERIISLLEMPEYGGLLVIHLYGYGTTETGFAKLSRFNPMSWWTKVDSVSIHRLKEAQASGLNSYDLAGLFIELFFDKPATGM